MVVPNLKEAMKRSKENGKVQTIHYVLEEELKGIAKGKRYFIKTYGCQMNEHDSENIKALLEELGFSQIDCMEEADLILLNTCAIRENAHNKVFGFLGRIKNIKEKRPHVIAGISGCMAQEEVVVNEILKKYNYIECQLKTGRTHQIRVHMSYINHPLLGDKVYGPPVTKPFQHLQGQTLHAKILGFHHPATNQYIEVEAPLPQYFVQLIESMKTG